MWALDIWSAKLQLSAHTYSNFNYFLVYESYHCSSPMSLLIFSYVTWARSSLMSASPWADIFIQTWFFKMNEYLWISPAFLYSMQPDFWFSWSEINIWDWKNRSVISYHVWECVSEGKCFSIFLNDSFSDLDKVMVIWYASTKMFWISGSLWFPVGNVFCFVFTFIFHLWRKWKQLAVIVETMSFYFLLWY